MGSNAREAGLKGGKGEWGKGEWKERRKTKIQEDNENKEERTKEK